MMRLYTSLLMLCLLISLGQGRALAQKSEYPRALWVGAHGGMQMSRITFSPNVSQHMHMGQWGGAMLRYDVEKGASLQLEFNYSASGWKEKYEAESLLAYSRHLKYLEMPLLGHLYIGEAGARAFIGAGPVIGWLIGESSSRSGEGFSEASILRHSLPVEHKLFWGLTFAPGISLGLAQRHRLELEGRIVIGFGDLWKNARTEPYGQSSAMRFGLGLSYLYRL